MKRLLAGLMVGSVMTLIAGPVQAKPKTPTPQNPPPITVRGGYINDVPCIPMSFDPTDDAQVYVVECTAMSMLNGDFTGREIAHFKATASTSGRFSGDYDAILIGTYAGDHSHGALHRKGHFTVDENSQFVARDTIVSGTCDWAGSTGSMNFDGFSVNGGYVGQWQRPAAPPAADPSCNPVDGLPG